MAHQSDREIVLNVLGRTYPEYIWAYGMIKIGKIYEGRELSVGATFSQIASLEDAGALERKMLNGKEMRESIESLVNAGRLNRGDITVYGDKITGYRLTNRGKRIRDEERETTAESGYRGLLVPA